MTQENRESMQRAIGMIEGAMFGASERVRDALSLAVDYLENILKEDKEEGGIVD